ncbi:MAG TPA: hypothetical protein VNT54_01365 [Solirubrobacteraceae bacterium]|nr:hypothetical protein [Solirubrobacteraceae bacterium]
MLQRSVAVLADLASRVLLGGAAGRRRQFAGYVALAMISAASMPAVGVAEQASQPGSAAAAQLDVGRHHSCAVLAGGQLRCWGYGAQGQLGYASTATIGDDEMPGSTGPVDLGEGRTATAISAGDFHTCALLDDGSVRCWGYGADGRLGYGDTQNVGDDESPGSAGPVDLGEGRTATAISAGLGHTCAVLDDGSVRCWGYGENGALGYANTDTIGDDETPGSVGPVDIGEGRTATAISAGGDFTCVILDDRTVRCWGLALDGRLGYGNNQRIGDDETPGSVGPVDIGAGRTATAISAGARGTCARLDDAAVRCWGEGREGSLGYGNGQYIGDNETPGSVGPVDIGSGRSARAISAGRHTCAVLDLGSVRCWGANTKGQLGYGNTERIGDDETPAAAGPVDLGAGRSATAISAGELHTCARLDDGSVRCWGYGGNGRLGYCNERDIGDDETPGSAGPVNLATAVHCPARVPSLPPDAPPPAPAPPAPAPSAPPASSAGPLTAKLALTRARIVRRDRMLDVFAPITSLASGWTRVELHAAGLIYSFRARIEEGDARIRFRKRIPRAQAQLATGILTIGYSGDADTRPQTVRLRAASQPADLRLSRPRISNGRLRASGTVSRRARGVVRVQMEYVAAGTTHTREFKARIASGRWSLNEQLSQTVRTGIAQRTGTVHSYTLFTGYYPRRIRGEMRSFQILGPR